MSKLLTGVYRRKFSLVIHAQPIKPSILPCNRWGKIAAHGHEHTRTPHNVLIFTLTGQVIHYTLRVVLKPSLLYSSKLVVKMPVFIRSRALPAMLMPVFANQMWQSRKKYILFFVEWYEMTLNMVLLLSV